MNLEFSDHSNHSYVEEDTYIQMECSIRADPEVIDITWHHNDRLLKEDSIKGVVIRNHTIEIERVKKEHRGMYRCFATNAIGRGTSNYVQLDIMCKYFYFFKFTSSSFRLFDFISNTYLCMYMCMCIVLT